MNQIVRSEFEQTIFKSLQVLKNQDKLCVNIKGFITNVS